jgi:WhiB family redox-sensing transcriptional regulator
MDGDGGHVPIGVYRPRPVELADLLGVDLASLGWVRPSWWSAAACRGQGVARFFPVTAKGGHDARAEAEARLVCASCPVVASCLEVALSVQTSVDRFGVYGGTDWRQRQVLRELGPPGEVAQAWASGSLSVVQVA